MKLAKQGKLSKSRILSIEKKLSKELKQKGLKFIFSVDQAKKGVVIIRAHGKRGQVPF